MGLRNADRTKVKKRAELGRERTQAARSWRRSVQEVEQESNSLAQFIRRGEDHRVGEQENFFSVVNSLRKKVGCVAHIGPAVPFLGASFVSSKRLCLDSVSQPGSVMCAYHSGDHLPPIPAATFRSEHFWGCIEVACFLCWVRR